MRLKLVRKPAEGKSVRGTLYVSNSPCPFRGKGTAEPGERGYSFLCSTLENSDYLILPLIYKLSVTYSPKFKRPLPLVNDVPKAIASSSSAGAHQASFACPSSSSGTHQLPERGLRSGIRFHSGSKPEHSRGCILVSREMEKKIAELIMTEKEVKLEIN